MPRPRRPWTVTRHEPIEELDENLWAVDGDVPGYPSTARFHRRMHIVKLFDGRLVFHNAIPLDDAALGKIAAWGKPAILIVPMHLHMMDAHAFQERLELSVYTSTAARPLVEQTVRVAGTLEELPRDPALRCEPLSGTRFGEAAYVVQSGPRASLLFCDAIHNSNQAGTGFAGLMFRLMGFYGPEPKVPPMYKLRAVSDKPALKRDLLRLAETPGLVRLVPSHGAIVANDPAGALRRAAEAAL
jgi:hypothetical protein